MKAGYLNVKDKLLKALGKQRIIIPLLQQKFRFVHCSAFYT